jgi:hypothetical protein
MAVWSEDDGMSKADIPKLASLGSAIHFVRGDRGSQCRVLFQWVRNVDVYHREIVDRGAEVIQESQIDLATPAILHL